MTSRRFRTCALLACGVLLLSGCAGRRHAARVTPEIAAAGGTGLYRVSVRDSAEGQRRFRMLLFAALPDRLHAEVVSPVGSVVMILDGGQGRMAVTFVRDRVAFEGPGDEDALERVLGVRLSLEALVRGVLTGDVGAPQVRVTREAAGSPELPSLLVLDDGRRSLTLELKRLQPPRAASAELGNGRAPAGMDVRPLSELSLYDAGDALPGEPGS